MNPASTSISGLVPALVLVFSVTSCGGARAPQAPPAPFPEKPARMWEPVEWQLENDSARGNPFDVVADVAFVHETSGETRRTPMFYAGGKAWKFRFTATRRGRWSFSSSSDDPDLHDRTGTVMVVDNPGARGFVRSRGNKWIRSATGEAFVPQYVMYAGPHAYHGRPEVIDAAIETFLVRHGFSGFHVPVYCRWFDIGSSKASGIRSSNPNPDLRTFDALELLIQKTYAAGGVVHLWMWGDDANDESVARWGRDGDVDRRLQRYIGARLGPLPGWTMGYGYDCFEYAKHEMLRKWRENHHRFSGWPHLLGARNYREDIKRQLSEGLDYMSYENIRPLYDDSTFRAQKGFGYLQTYRDRSGRPSFSEDRFRLRDPTPYPWKDYTELATRRGLYHSTFAGGVANIWGNLVGAAGANDGSTSSAPYPRPHWIKTYSSFIAGRFLADMEPDTTSSNGRVLRTEDARQFLVYREDCDTIELDLGAAPAALPAIAVDALQPYEEIDLGMLDPKRHQLTLPRGSDWAIAIGVFER